MMIEPPGCFLSSEPLTSYSRPSTSTSESVAAAAAAPALRGADGLRASPPRPIDGGAGGGWPAGLLGSAERRAGTRSPVTAGTAVDARDARFF